MKKVQCYIFDVDGTLSNNSHRLKYIQSEPKDWDKFYEGIPDDEPISNTVEILRILSTHHPILIVTGRSDKYRNLTQDWLTGHGIYNVALFCRKDGDYRPDYEIKREIYLHEIEPSFDVLGVFEDRSSVVKMWRELGLTCYQVAEGDF